MGLQSQAQMGIQSQIAVLQDQMSHEAGAQAELSRQAQEAADRLVAEALQREALARREMDALRAEIAQTRADSNRGKSRTRSRRAASSGSCRPAERLANQVRRDESVPKGATRPAPLRIPAFPNASAPRMRVPILAGRRRPRGALGAGISSSSDESVRDKARTRRSKAPPMYGKIEIGPLPPHQKLPVMGDVCCGAGHRRGLRRCPCVGLVPRG